MRHFFLLCMLSVFFSCKIKSTEEAVIFSKDFLSENKYAIEEIKYYMTLVDGKKYGITFSTKPGSHVLKNDCPQCHIGLSERQCVNLANDIDNLNLTRIRYKNDAYIELGLAFRNEFFNNYFMRYYYTLSDTSLYANPAIRQIYLRDRWVLYSDTEQDH